MTILTPEEKALRFRNFNNNMKTDAQSVSASLGQLKTSVDKGVQAQVYARKNPDGTVGDYTLAKMGVILDDLKVRADAISAVMNDMIAVKNSAMTVEELHTKYPFDLGDYALELDN